MLQVLSAKEQQRQGLCSRGAVKKISLGTGKLQYHMTDGLIAEKPTAVGLSDDSE